MIICFGYCEPNYSYRYLKNRYNATDEECIYYQAIGELHEKRMITCVETVVLKKILLLSSKQTVTTDDLDTLAEMVRIPVSKAESYILKLKEKGYLELKDNNEKHELKICIPVDEEKLKLGMPRYVSYTILDSFLKSMLELSCQNPVDYYQEATIILDMILTHIVNDFSDRCMRLSKAPKENILEVLDWIPNNLVELTRNACEKSIAASKEKWLSPYVYE